MVTRRLLILSAVATALAGCNSIRTTAWNRAENGSLYEDADATNLKVIPVMLKVPTHLEVVVRQTLYVAHDEDNDVLEVVTLRRPALAVDAQLLYTEKMFLVDPVRVASGTGKYSFGFTGEKGLVIPNSNGDKHAGHGYLHDLNYKAEDTTIVEGSNLLSTVLKMAKPSSTRVSKAEEMGLFTVERVVAYCRFDLSEECVEEKVRGFLDVHLNGCHSCGRASASGFKTDPKITIDTRPSGAAAVPPKTPAKKTPLQKRFPELAETDNRVGANSEFIVVQSGAQILFLPEIVAYTTVIGQSRVAPSSTIASLGQLRLLTALGKDLGEGKAPTKTIEVTLSSIYFEPRQIRLTDDLGIGKLMKLDKWKILGIEGVKPEYRDVELAPDLLVLTRNRDGASQVFLFPYAQKISWGVDANGTELAWKPATFSSDGQFKYLRDRLELRDGDVLHLTRLEIVAAILNPRR